MKKHFFVFGIFAILFYACNNKASIENLTISKENNSRPKTPKAEGKLRILFIGNSHLEYFVSAPVLFHEICQANNQPMNIDCLVTFGDSIDKIFENLKTDVRVNFAETDKDGNYYDYVIIQEAIPVALTDPDKYKADVKMVVEKIRKNSPDVTIYIYEGMPPTLFTDPDYKKYYTEMRKNAVSVTKATKNAHLIKIADAINDAYNGKNNYLYLVENKDNLRFCEDDLLFGENTLHLLNDGGFMQAVLTYATIFDKKPTIPKELTLNTETGNTIDKKRQEVNKVISNPKALVEIAYNNR
jgi:hypothetical protein